MPKKINLYHIPLKLQLFGVEPTPAPAADAPPAPTPATDGDPRNTLQNPLLVDNSVPANPALPLDVPPTDTGNEPPAPEPELIMGKYKTQGELENAYQEAQRKITEQGQQLSAFQQSQQQFQALLQQLQQPGFQPQPQKPTPEQLAEQENQWIEQFYEKPVTQVNSLVENKLQEFYQKFVQPIVAERDHQAEINQYNQQEAELRATKPDFEQLVPQMQEVISEQGQYLKSFPNPVELAYNIAKARTIESVAPPTPEQLLQDPDFRSKILGNEELRNEIIKGYADSVQNGQPPTVIGNQPASGIPATPPTDIKSTADAKRASLAFFQRMLGGGQ